MATFSDDTPFTIPSLQGVDADTDMLYKFTRCMHVHILTHISILNHVCYLLRVTALTSTMNLLSIGVLYWKKVSTPCDFFRFFVGLKTAHIMAGMGELCKGGCDKKRVDDLAAGFVYTRALAHP